MSRGERVVMGRLCAEFWPHQIPELIWEPLAKEGGEGTIPQEGISFRPKLTST